MYSAREEDFDPKSFEIDPYRDPYAFVVHLEHQENQDVQEGAVLVPYPYGDTTTSPSTVHSSGDHTTNSDPSSIITPLLQNHQHQRSISDDNTEGGHTDVPPLMRETKAKITTTRGPRGPGQNESRGAETSRRPLPVTPEMREASSTEGSSVIQERDAGMYVDELGGMIPPSYDPQWARRT